MVCYVKYGETLNFGLDKQIERMVEILALSALLREETIPAQRTIMKNKLKQYAFPVEIDLK